MYKRHVLQIAAVAFSAIVVLGGCANLFSDEDSDSSDSETVDPVDYGDPSAIGDEVLEEVTNEAFVADESTGVYTVFVRDRDTDQPISEDVTVNVQNGTASSVDSDGKFTVTPAETDQDGGLSIQVLVPGYTVPTYSVSDSVNIAYKEPIAEGVIGEWILYKVEDSITGEEYAVYTESVTFGADGRVRWEGDRVSSLLDSEYYYSTTERDDGTIGFGRLGSREIPWAGIGSSVMSGPIFYAHVGIPSYLPADDILTIFAVGRLAPEAKLYYSRDGRDPDDSDDTGGTTPGEINGTMSFRGSSVAGSAFDAGDGTWAITGGDIVVAVSNAPADGSASLGPGAFTGTNLNQPGISVTNQSSFETYYSTSGSIQTTGGSLVVNATVEEAFSVLLGGGGTSYSFSFTPN